MAIELASTYVSVGLSTDGLHKQIEKAFGDAGGKASGAFGKKFNPDKAGIGKKFGKIAKIGVGAVGAIGAAVGGLALKGGMERALKIEGAQAKLKGLGHDAASVEKIMKNSLAAVKGTAFGLDAAAGTAAGAVAAGIKPGQQLEKVLKSVANASAATGSSMEDMGGIYNKVASVGKAQNDVLQQVAERGLPIYAALGEELEKTSEEVFKMASKGQIDFATFEKAMTRAAGTVADEMGNTLPGKIDNAKAAMSRMGAAAVSSFLPMISTGVSGVTDIFDKLTPVVERGGEVVAGAFASAQRSAQAFIKSGDVQSRLQGIGRAVREAFGSVGDFAGKALVAVRDLGGGFVEGFGGIDAVLSTFKDTLPLVLGPLGMLKTALMDAFSNINIDASGMRSFGQQVGSALKPLLGVVGQLAAGISGALGKAFTQLLPVLGKLGGTVGSVVGHLAQLAQKLAPLFTQLIQGLMPPLQRGLAAIGDVIGRVVDALSPLIQSIADRLAPLFMNIAQQAAPLLRKAFEAVASIAELLGPILGELARIVSEKVGAAFQFLAPVVELAFNAISTSISVALDVIRGIIDTATALMKGDWSGVWNAMKSTVTGIWETMKGSVSSAIETVRATISGVTGIIKRNWDAFWGGMKTAGQNAWNWISSTATSVFDKMVEPIRDAFTSIKQAVDSVWSGIKGVVARPINVVIRFINDGIIGGYNWVARMLSMKELTPIPELAGYARGGILPGTSSWRDGDDQLIMARRGEGITVSEALRDPYERKRLLALNDAARKGVSPERFRQMFDAHPQGYAKGGIVSWKGKKFTAVFAAALKVAEKLAGHAFRITQGGFRPRTSYSGTSHQGDAVDIARPYSVRTVAALRKSGVAAWDRAGKGNWIDHIHGVPLPGYGSPAGSAVRQAQSYLRGGDGLGGRDNGPRGAAILEGIKGLAAALQAGFESVKDWFSGIWEKVTGPFKSFQAALPGGNIISNLAEGVANKLKSTLHDWIKEKIGGFAGGTTSAPPGLAWVGERGPELVRFRGGERVWSNSESVRMAAQPSQTQVRIELVDERIRGLIRAEVRQMKREGLVAA